MIDHDIQELNLDYKRCYRFYKKIVIADNLAILVDGVFNNVDNYSGITLIVATIFFTFQIYCDFSGYSDIAIGSARVMGFEGEMGILKDHISQNQYKNSGKDGISLYLRGATYLLLFLHE